MQLHGMFISGPVIVMDGTPLETVCTWKVLVRKFFVIFLLIQKSRKLCRYTVSPVSHSSRFLIARMQWLFELCVSLSKVVFSINTVVLNSRDWWKIVRM